MCSVCLSICLFGWCLFFNFCQFFPPAERERTVAARDIEIHFVLSFVLCHTRTIFLVLSSLIQCLCAFVHVMAVFNSHFQTYCMHNNSNIPKFTIQVNEKIITNVRVMFVCAVSVMGQRKMVIDWYCGSS